MIALLLFAAAPPAVPPAEWGTLIERLKADPYIRRRIEELPEEALPLLRRADSPSLEVEVRLRLHAAADAIRSRHWGLIRAMGPGAKVAVPGGGYWFNRVRFTRNGKKALVAGGAVMLYDLATGKEERRVLEVAGARHGLEISADGKFGLTGHSSEFVPLLLEVPTLRMVRGMSRHVGVRELGLHAVALSPDGKLAASTVRPAGVRIDAVADGSLVAVCEESTDCWSLAFSPDGKTLAAGFPDRVRLYDARTGKLRKAIPLPTDETPNSLCWLPDGGRLLAGAGSGRAVLLRLRDGKELRRFNHGGLTEAALSPDGLRCATAAGHEVKVWDVESGRLLHTLEGHVDTVLGVAFSPDGTRLLSCDAVACIRLWRIGRY
jgi:WD40 repeat protein